MKQETDKKPTDSLHILSEILLILSLSYKLLKASSMILILKFKTTATQSDSCSCIITWQMPLRYKL
jgi:hypothetical protein